MDGAFTAVAPEPRRERRAAGVSRGDEPARRRRARRHHGGPGGKTGFTATAVCSVSDAPATLLVCLNRRSNGGPLLAQNGVFCVNTLAPTKKSSPTCSPAAAARRWTSAFRKCKWTTLKTGAPVLASAVVAFDCRTIEIKAVASTM